MKPDKRAHPVHILLLGTVAIMPIPNAFPNLVEQAHGLKRRTTARAGVLAGFAGLYMTVHKTSIGAKRQRHQELLGAGRGWVYRSGGRESADLRSTTS